MKLSIPVHLGLPLLLVACETEEAPPTPSPAPPPAAPPAAAVPPPAAPTDRVPIVPQPIPVAERLPVCDVVLTHVEYDVDAGSESSTTHHPSTLARLWPDDREGQWHDVAPIPLRRAQAEAQGIPVDAQHSSGVVLTGDGGAFSYSFDEQGQTTQVSWDPSADSGTYTYAYHYTCDTPRTLRWDAGE